MPVTRSTSSGVHLATSALIWSMPQTRVADELLVLPVILEDVPENTPDQGDIRTRTEPDIFIRMGRRAGKAWITHDQRRIVALLGAQHMQKGNRMRLRRVAANDENRAWLLWMSL